MERKTHTRSQRSPLVQLLPLHSSALADLRGPAPSKGPGLFSPVADPVHGCTGTGPGSHAAAAWPYDTRSGGPGQVEPAHVLAPDHPETNSLLNHSTQPGQDRPAAPINHTPKTRGLSACHFDSLGHGSMSTTTTTTHQTVWSRTAKIGPHDSGSGVEQRQLAGLISRKSGVRVPLPPVHNTDLRGVLLGSLTGSRGFPVPPLRPLVLTRGQRVFAWAYRHTAFDCASGPPHGSRRTFGT